MKHKHILCLIFLATAPVLLAGCNPSAGTDIYGPGTAGRAMPVQYGTITDRRSVELRNLGNSDQVIGAIAGGVGGALLGSQFGGGKGKALATGAGAIAGATGGSALGKTMTRIPATEWTVHLDSGATIAVVQNDANLSIGQHVRVIHDSGRVRLVP